MKVINVMKILIIEDEENVASLLMDAIESKFLDQYSDLIIEKSDFEKASKTMNSLEPDAVILDVSVPGTLPGEDEPGIEIIDKIWNSKFCPLIIYTAVPEKIKNTGELNQHPFVEILPKGPSSEEKVVNDLYNFISHIKALNEAERSFRNTYHKSMRYLAPYVFNVPNIDDQERVQLLLRSGKRRFAALCDEDINNEAGLESWEQYIFPPINNDLLLGDIIQRKNAQFSEIDSFRIVLTPSCDLVTSKNRDAKVESVLVSKCCSMLEALKEVSLKDISTKKLISKVLNAGYYEIIVPFPELANTIPLMAANLRELELISIDKIHKGGDDDSDSTECEYKRIASLDSPFRELISWAYQQIACRPGLPDRNVEAWASKIEEAISQDKEK